MDRGLSGACGNFGYWKASATLVAGRAAFSNSRELHTVARLVYRTAAKVSTTINPLSGHASHASATLYTTMAHFPKDFPSTHPHNTYNVSNETEKTFGSSSSPFRAFGSERGMCWLLQNYPDPCPSGMAFYYIRSLLFYHHKVSLLFFVSCLQARFFGGCFTNPGRPGTSSGRTCWTFQTLVSLSLRSLSRWPRSLTLRRARHCSHSGKVSSTSASQHLASGIF